VNNEDEELIKGIIIFVAVLMVINMATASYAQDAARSS